MRNGAEMGDEKSSVQHSVQEQCVKTNMRRKKDKKIKSRGQ